MIGPGIVGTPQSMNRRSSGPRIDVPFFLSPENGSLIVVVLSSRSRREKLGPRMVAPDPVPVADARNRHRLADAASLLM